MQAEKVLGVLWNFEKDVLSIRPISKVFEDIKRGMLDTNDKYTTQVWIPSATLQRN